MSVRFEQIHYCFRSNFLALLNRSEQHKRLFCVVIKYLFCMKRQHIVSVTSERQRFKTAGSTKNDFPNERHVFDSLRIYCHAKEPYLVAIGIDCVTCTDNVSSGDTAPPVSKRHLQIQNGDNLPRLLAGQTHRVCSKDEFLDKYRPQVLLQQFTYRPDQ